MIQKHGHIKNPLTVIAIFAGIAEIFGTLILPHLDSSVQSELIIFLTISPFFLVTLFFITLWWKHHVLYAPSDYREESNFMDNFRKSSPKYLPTPSISDGQAEEDRVPSTEVFGDSAEEVPTSENASQSNREYGLEVTETQLAYSRAQRSQMKREIAEFLCSGLGGTFEIDVSPKSYPNAKFDIVIDAPKQYWVVQVITARGRAKLTNAVQSMYKIGQFYQTLSTVDKQRFNARLIFIMRDNDTITEEVKERLLHDIRSLPYPIEIEEQYPDQGIGRMMEIS